MNTQLLNHTWPQMRAAVREYWPHLSEEDVSAMAGERDDLMRMLKVRHPKRTYAEIEREVTEFELRDVRAAYAARPSLGIPND